MWDLKLNLLSFFFFLNLTIYNFSFQLFNLIDPFLQNGFFFFNTKMIFFFYQNMVFFTAIKFLILIGFLILIRGGTPRYRYDYLTKLGWLKFIGYVIFAFVFVLLSFLFY